MIDEKVKEHFNDAENGLGGLMEAVARARKLGQAAWKEKEASERTAESLSWTQSVTESVSGVREINTNLKELSGGSPGEDANAQIQDSERVLAEVEFIERAAREAVESSIRSLQGELGGVDAQSDAARKAADSAGQLAKVASDAVGISSKVSREALKTSLEASKEAIDRAAAISRNARSATRASSDAAEAACATSRQTVSNAAEESIMAFRKLIIQTEELGKATNAVIEASFREFEESLELPSESEFEAVPVVLDEEPVSGGPKMDNPESGENEIEKPVVSEEPAGGQPNKKIPELRDTNSRLESLVSMFNKERD
jgi:hypothetical protein